MSGRRILSAYGSSICGVLSGLLTNLWLLRAIANTVDKNSLGLYVICITYAGYLGTLQLGLDFAAGREIAGHLGKDDPTGARRVYNALNRFNRKLACILLPLIALAAALLWSGVLIADPHNRRLAALLAVFACLWQVLQALTRPYFAALIGSRRQTLANAFNIVIGIASTLTAYGLLTAGYGVLCIPLANVIIQAATWPILSAVSRRECPWLAIDDQGPTGQALGTLLRFGTITTLGGIAWTIESTCDTLILDRYFGESVVAAYLLWWRIPQMIFDFSTRFTFSAFPEFAERHGASVAAFESLFRKVAYVILGLATLALIGISFFLPSFVQLWIGPSWKLDDARQIAFAMGLLVALRTVGNLFGVAWMATGQPLAPNLLGVAQALVKLACAFLLIRTFGLLGGVAASCISASVQVLGMGYLLLRKNFFTGKLILHAVCLIGLALWAASQAPFNEAHLSMRQFAAFVAATALLWGIVWALLALRGEMRPALLSLLSIRSRES